MAKTKISIAVEESLRSRVAALAAEQERSFSAMFGLLVERGLEDPGGGNGRVALGRGKPVGGGGASAVDVAVLPGSSSPRFEPVPAKVRRGKRTVMCVHRVSPEAFCKFGCD